MAKNDKLFSPSTKLTDVIDALRIMSETDKKTGKPTAAAQKKMQEVKAEATEEAEKEAKVIQARGDLVYGQNTDPSAPNYVNFEEKYPKSEYIKPYEPRNVSEEEKKKSEANKERSTNYYKSILKNKSYDTRELGLGKLNDDDLVTFKDEKGKEYTTTARNAAKRINFTTGTTLEERNISRAVSKIEKLIGNYTDALGQGAPNDELERRKNAVDREIKFFSQQYPEVYRENKEYFDSKIRYAEDSDYRETMDGAGKQVQYFMNAISTYNKRVEQGASEGNIAKAKQAAKDNLEILKTRYPEYYAENAAEFESMYYGMLSSEELDRLRSTDTDTSGIGEIYNTARTYEERLKSLEKQKQNRINTWKHRSNGSVTANTSDIDKKIGEAKAERDNYLKSVGYANFFAVEKEYNRKKNGVAISSPDGDITWEELYNGALKNEIETAAKKNADFEEKSKYVKKDVKYVSANPYSDTDFSMKPEHGYEDSHFYNLVNGEEDAVANDASAGLNDEYIGDRLKYSYLTDEERAIFNYLWKTGDKDTAKKYVEASTSDVEARRAKKQKENDIAFAKEHPVIGSVYTVGQRIASVPKETISTILDVTDDGRINPNSYAYRGSRSVDTIRSTVEENIDNPIGKFFYRHGMNLADNTAAMALGGFGAGGTASKIITTGVQSLGSFSSTVRDASERGLSGGEAIALGLISAGAETFFESKTFDSLFDGKTLKKSALSYLADNIKTELVGELSTEAVNDIADALIAEDLSNWQLSIDNYMAEGLSKDEALRETIWDWGKKYADVAGGTLFSSGVMSGAPALGSTIADRSNKKSYGKSVAQKGNAAKVLDMAAAYPEDSSVGKLYKRYSDKGYFKDGAKQKPIVIGNLADRMMEGAYATLALEDATAEQKESASAIISQLESFAKTSEETPTTIETAAESAIDSAMEEIAEANTEVGTPVESADTVVEQVETAEQADTVESPVRSEGTTESGYVPMKRIDTAEAVAETGDSGKKSTVTLIGANGLETFEGVSVAEDTGYDLTAVERNGGITIVEKRSGMEFAHGATVEEAVANVRNTIAENGKELIDATVKEAIERRKARIKASAGSTSPIEGDRLSVGRAVADAEYTSTLLEMAKTSKNEKARKAAALYSSYDFKNESESYRALGDIAKILEVSEADLVKSRAKALYAKINASISDETNIVKKLDSKLREERKAAVDRGDTATVKAIDYLVNVLNSEGGIISVSEMFAPNQYSAENPNVAVQVYGKRMETAFKNIGLDISVSVYYDSLENAARGEWTKHPDGHSEIRLNGAKLQGEQSAFWVVSHELIHEAESKSPGITQRMLDAFTKMGMYDGSQYEAYKARYSKKCEADFKKALDRGDVTQDDYDEFVRNYVNEEIVADLMSETMSSSELVEVFAGKLGKDDSNVIVSFLKWIKNGIKKVFNSKDEFPNKFSDIIGMFEGAVKGKRLTSDTDNDIIISETFDDKGDYYERKESENSSVNDSGKRRFSIGSYGRSSQLGEGSRRFAQSPRGRQRRSDFTENLRKEGKLQTKEIYGINCDIIPVNYFDNDMRSIAKDNLKSGVERTVFVSGDLKVKEETGKEHKAKGAYIVGDDGKKTIIIQYDNYDYSPKQINYHERIHNEYDAERVQATKDAILASLSATDKRSVFESIERNLAGLSDLTKTELVEELCANVLSGMDYLWFGNQFNELRNAFWDKNDSFIKSFKKHVTKQKYDLNDILYNGSAAKVYKGSVFPPDNEYPHSEANKLSTQWAHKKGINNHTKKIIYFNGQSYLIEKNNDYPLKYRIVANIDAVDQETAERFIRERRHNHERNFGIQSGGKGTIQDNKRNRGFNSNRRGDFDDGNSADKYSSKIEEIERMGGEQNAERRIDVERGRASERSVEDTQGNVKRKFALSNSITPEQDAEYLELAKNPEKNDTTTRKSLTDTGVYSLEDAWAEKVKKYGAIPKGEKAARDVKVPKKISENKFVSRGARSALESGLITEEFVPVIQQAILDGEFTYERFPDDKAEAKAKETIEYHGFEGALEHWEFLMHSGGAISKENFSLGIALFNQCAQNGDFKNAEKILADLSVEATRAGQAIQSMRLLKKMSPDGTMYYLEKSIDKINDELVEKFGEKRAKKVKINEELARKYFAEKDAKNREKLYDELCKDIGEQIPSTFWEKADAWRYVAMLLNPTTHIRNVAGNIFNKFVIMADHAVEGALQPILVKRENRTRTWRIADKKTADFAKNDWELMRDVLTSGEGKYNNMMSDIDKNRRILRPARQSSTRLFDNTTKTELFSWDSGLTDDIDDGIIDKGKQFDNEVNGLGQEDGLQQGSGDRGSDKGAYSGDDGQGVQRVSETSNSRTEKNKFGNIYERFGKVRGYLKEYGISGRNNGDKNVESGKYVHAKKFIDNFSRAGFDVVNIGDSVYAYKKYTNDISGKHFEYLDNFDKIARTLGITVHYAENMIFNYNEGYPQKKYAFRTGDNIFLNVAVLDEVQGEDILSHELFHYIFDNYPEFADSFVDTVLNNRNRDNDALFGNFLQGLCNLYGFDDVYSDKSLNKLTNEMMAYVVGCLEGQSERASNIRSLFNNQEDIKAAWNGLVEKVIEEQNTRELEQNDSQNGFDSWDDFGKRRAFADTGKVRKAVGNAVGFIPEVLRKFNSWGLEAEDAIFLGASYKSALRKIITARKLNVDNITPEQLSDIRDLAMKDALRATFREANWLAESISKAKSNLMKGNAGQKLAGIALGGVFPFTKTPMNITKQALEHSPLGVFKTASDIVKKARGGEVSGNDIIADLARTFTGTGLAVLGFVLARAGFVSAGDDEDPDKKRFDKLVGEQSYAITVGGKSYTIDWATPASIPFLVGAQFFDATSDSGINIKTAMDSLTKIAEPVIGLSMLDGLRDFMQSDNYAEGQNPLFAGAYSTLESYVLQFFPTLGGKIHRIYDGEKKNYYFVDKNSNAPEFVQELYGSVASKLPFAVGNFQPSVDLWGRIENHGGIGERLAENLISPGYYSEENYTEVDEELLRLYESTGNGDVFPKKMYEDITIDGHKYYMNAEHYTEAAIMLGKRRFDMLSRLFNDEIVLEKQDVPYSEMSDSEKAKIVSDVYYQALDETKYAMFDKVRENSARYGDVPEFDSEAKIRIGAENAEIFYKGDPTGENAYNYEIYSRANDFLKKTDKILADADLSDEEQKKAEADILEYANAFPFEGTRGGELAAAFYDKIYNNGDPKFDIEYGDIFSKYSEYIDVDATIDGKKYKENLSVGDYLELGTNIAAAEEILRITMFGTESDVSTYAQPLMEQYKNEPWIQIVKAASENIPKKDEDKAAFYKSVMSDVRNGIKDSYDVKYIKEASSGNDTVDRLAISKDMSNKAYSATQNGTTGAQRVYWTQKYNFADQAYKAIQGDKLSNKAGYIKDLENLSGKYDGKLSRGDKLIAENYDKAGNDDVFYTGAESYVLEKSKDGIKYEMPMSYHDYKSMTKYMDDAKEYAALYVFGNDSDKSSASKIRNQNGSMTTWIADGLKATNSAMKGNYDLYKKGKLSADEYNAIYYKTLVGKIKSEIRASYRESYFKKRK